MPDANTRWVLGALALLAGLILHQGAATRARLDGGLDGLRADMQAGFTRLDGGLDSIDDRLQIALRRVTGYRLVRGAGDRKPA